MDQTLAETRGPDPCFGVALLEDSSPTGSRDQFTHVGEFSARVKPRHYLAADGVSRHSGGVAQWSEDELGVALRLCDDPLLDLVMDGRLLSAEEASAHVDAVSSQGQGRDQTAGIGDPARGQNGHVHRVRGCG